MKTLYILPGVTQTCNWSNDLEQEKNLRVDNCYFFDVES